jgi:hypothetical protein
MRRRILALLWLIAAVMFAAALILMPKAHADELGDAAWMWIQRHGPEFCTTLAAHPDRTGALAGAQAILAQGFTADETGAIAVWSTARFCPEWLPLLKRIAGQAETARFA